MQVATGTGMQMGALAVSGAGMGPSRHTMALSVEFVCLLQAICPSSPRLHRGPPVQFGEKPRNYCNCLLQLQRQYSPCPEYCLSVSSPFRPSLSVLFTEDSCGCNYSLPSHLSDVPLALYVEASVGSQAWPRPPLSSALPQSLAGACSFP